MFSRANIFPKKHKNFFSNFPQYNLYSKAFIVILIIFNPINLIHSNSLNDIRYYENEEINSQKTNKFSEKEEYILGPGDIIDIDVNNITELSGKYEIGPTGELYLPRLREIIGEGYTLEEFKHKIDKDQIILVIKQLVDFFILLRNKGYCYYDLSLNNILIDDNLNIKVIDYESLYKIDNKPTNLVGTYGFVSPEYFKDNILDYEKNYIFSLGIILFFLCFKYYLFSKSDYYFKKCWKWCRETDCNRNNCLSKYLDKKLIDNNLLKKLIFNCLNFNFNKRISINEIYLLINSF